MSPHPSDDDLVLHYYAEGGEPAVGAHLQACAECRRTYDELARTLAVVTDADVPERGPEYGRAVWQRLQPQLRRVRPARPVLRRLAPFAALAASLVFAFVLGRVSREGEVRPAHAPIPAPVRERILLVAVGEHLERSQLVLLELENASGNGTVDISNERQLAERLVPANRLYRQAAQRAGEPAVAGVLDELERVLIQVAMSPDAMPSGDFAELRRRMEAQGIVFKVRVLSSRMRERGRPSAAPVNGSQS